MRAYGPRSTTQHIPILNYSTPTKKKQKQKNSVYTIKKSNTNTILNTPYLPTSPLSKHNLNDEKTNAINFWRR